MILPDRLTAAFERVTEVMARERFAMTDALGHLAAAPADCYRIEREPGTAA
jgi:hypothetical protein